MGLLISCFKKQNPEKKELSQAQNKLGSDFNTWTRNQSAPDGANDADYNVSAYNILCCPCAHEGANNSDYNVKYYYIRSCLNGRVLDAEFDNGALVVSAESYMENDRSSQLWYKHRKTGTIRNKKYGLCMEITDDRLVLKPYVNGRKNQLWKYNHAATEGLIVNGDNPRMVLAVAGSNTNQTTKVIKYTKNNEQNQRWSFKLHHVG